VLGTGRRVGYGRGLQRWRVKSGRHKAVAVINVETRYDVRGLEQAIDQWVRGRAEADGSGRVAAFGAFGVGVMPSEMFGAATCSPGRTAAGAGCLSGGPVRPYRGSGSGVGDELGSGKVKRGGIPDSAAAVLASPLVPSLAALTGTHRSATGGIFSRDLAESSLPQVGFSE
jgi:hypothetical protein